MEVLARLRIWRAEVVERDSRVTVLARRNGGILRLHLRNTGRLRDLIYPGSQLACVDWSGGKTRGRVVGAWVGEDAAVIDTTLQAKMFEEAVARGLIPWLRGYVVEAREVWRLGSRLDYLLRAGRRRMLAELKSAVLLADDRAAMYPDTPSSRGVKHIKTLTRLTRMGAKTTLIFIAAHPHATHFRPNVDVDPRLGLLLPKAARHGVLIKAIKLYLKPDGRIVLSDPDLPVTGVKIN